MIQTSQFQGRLSSNKTACSNFGFQIAGRQIGSLPNSRVWAWRDIVCKIQSHPSPPGVNFINILWAAFTIEDLKSVKIQSSCHYLFALGICAHRSWLTGVMTLWQNNIGAKAVCKMLMKLTTGGEWGTRQTRK